MERTSPPFFTRPKIITRANEIIAALSLSGRALFYALAALIIGSAAGILLIVNDTLQVGVPLHGGSLTEGIIGAPRLINPILATEPADLDLAALVYSGLFKLNGSGVIVPDLATGYELSPDHRTYTVHLRDDAVFQNGEPVTADDVVFTVQKILDGAVKSPERPNWQGVTASAIDAHTVAFTLPSPYAPFIDNLTLGILPKQLWQNSSGQEFSLSPLNGSPIGSGPYRVVGINRSQNGAAASYSLKSFDRYAGGAPYLTALTIKFYNNEDDLVAALERGDVEAAGGISPSSLPKLQNYAVIAAPLDRVFGVFFDQNNNPALQDLAVRKALSQAVDRSALIAATLSDFAAPLGGPLPPGLYSDATSTSGSAPAASTMTPDSALTAAKETLAKAGYAPGQGGTLQKTIGKGKKAKTITLSFTLSTSDVPELRAVADSLTKTWMALGASVNEQVFDASDLTGNIIRPRKYDALLFGEAVGRGLDLYAFWDSAERNDPGLNIALYTNSSVDAILTKLRQGGDPAQAANLYKQFSDAIIADAPAVFLYSPEYLYVVPKDLKGITLPSIENPSDRFATVSQWYRGEDHVWKIFANTK